MKILLIAVCGLFMLLRPETRAQTPELKQSPLILAVTHLNPDAWADTLYGYQEGRSYIPSAVHWGRRIPAGDTARFMSNPHTTRLRVPEWPNFGCSVSHELLSTDTLTDIVIYMWGAERTKNPKTKEMEEKPLFRIVAVFGQRGLDDMEEIDLERIDSVQAKPFFARTLSLGRDYLEPALREQSGLVSYEVPRIELHSSKEEEKKGDATALFSVAPNPAAGLIRLSSKGLPAGGYTVTILTLEGTPTTSLPWTVTGEAASLDIDLSQISSGYYMISVSGEGIPAAVTPFVTVH